MKRIIIFLFAVALCTLASAQVVDQGRDLSKYADDKFGLDDQYTVATPYRTIPQSEIKLSNGILTQNAGWTDASAQYTDWK